MAYKGDDPVRDWLADPRDIRTSQEIAAVWVEDCIKRQGREFNGLFRSFLEQMLTPDDKGRLLTEPELLDALETVSFTSWLADDGWDRMCSDIIDSPPQQVTTWVEEWKKEDTMDDLHEQDGKYLDSERCRAIRAPGWQTGWRIG